MSPTVKLIRGLCALGLLAIVAALQPSHAQSSDEADIEAKYRAKIVKYKAKQASTQSMFGFGGTGPGQTQEPDCGSQSIGNVNTNGRAGQAPREVFVFAPNAINLVNGRGCR